MINGKKWLGMVIAACLGTGLSLAQAAPRESFKPAPVKVGGLNLYPILTLEERYDDNLFRQEEQERDSMITLISPGLKLEALSGPDRYLLESQADVGIFHSSRADDYVDHRTAASAHWEPSDRHAFDLSGIYERDHDRRGTEYFQGEEAFLIDEPDRFEKATLGAQYQLGNDKTPGRIELDLQAYDKSYRNNLERTTQRNRQNLTAGATFYWRLSDRSHALLEATHGWVDYDHEPEEIAGVRDSLNSSTARYLAGFTWKIASKTQGTLKAGYGRKDFDDPDRKDYSGLSWSGELSWLPKSYSMLTLTTGQRTDETTTRGDYIDVAEWGLAWRHYWTERVHTRLHATFREEEYVNDPRERNDDEMVYGLTAEYLVRRWLRLEGFLLHDRRDSNVDRLSYSRNLVGVAISASL